MKKLRFAAAALVLSFTGAASAATVEVFNVNGSGINFSQARADAYSQARVICDGMGGGMMTLEVIDSVYPGGHVIVYAMAECHIP